MWTVSEVQAEAASTQTATSQKSLNVGEGACTEAGVLFLRALLNAAFPRPHKRYLTLGMQFAQTCPWVYPRS